MDSGPPLAPRPPPTLPFPIMRALQVRAWLLGLLVVSALALGGWGCVPSTFSGEGGSLRLVSYNIRHGRGMDGAVDLERTARVLRALEPDLVGLQEVDRRVERSGGVDQAVELGRLLDMTEVFGAFMDYQGGEYGMAILTRLDLIRSWPIELPEGREPRIALAAEVVLPEGDTVVAVNVHFDWIGDDRDRFAQASALVAVLDNLPHPWILIGDVNDEPGSRTLALFGERAREAAKPRQDRLTFSTEDPRREIDFVFLGPPARWAVREVRVVDEWVASDHFPVLAVVAPVPPSAGR
jgi:endonuclease/exonuclease/phosphatase family metal-dependent hydrolase